MKKETANRINRAAERLSNGSAPVSKRAEKERAKQYVLHSNELDADIRRPRHGRTGAKTTA